VTGSPPPAAMNVTGRVGALSSAAWLRSLALVEAASAESRLGLVPPIALAGSAGLLLIALADSWNRLNVPNASVLFWFGLLLMALPAAARLLGAGASRAERFWLVVLLGLGLYAVKLLNSPGSFTFFDEFPHWRTLEDILGSGRLFTHNNELPVSPYYPGLEILTSVLVKGGLSIWAAGVVIIGAARLLLAVSLFLFVERAGGSTRLAGVATLIYMGNPSFLFFDAQFGYESLALPLAVFVLYCAVRRERGSSGGSIPLTVALILGLAAVIVTHHVSSIALAAFLVLWALASSVVGRLKRRTAAAPAAAARTAAAPAAAARSAPGLWGPALMAIFGTTAWMLYVASVTVGYLGPAFSGALNQVLDLIAGEETGRQLFTSSTGISAPAVEQVAGYASVVVLLLAMAVGGVVLWRVGRHNAALAALGLAALAYPVSLVARLTVRGAELAARSAEFVFLGLGVVAAVALLALLAHPLLRRYGRALLLTAIGVVFVGGVVIGFPFWARLPGPYLVSADSRSVEPIGISAADWMLADLGPDNHVLTDRVNRVLATAYGLQHAVTSVGDRANVRGLYFKPALDEDDLALLRLLAVRYVEIDRRLTTSVPYVGTYLESEELTELGPWKTPLPAADQDKWNVTAGVDRVYDNGPIQIYNLDVLLDAKP
jgi:hypothetical protein